MSVFALFVSSDPDSGRVDYYPSREAELDVTDLVVGRGALRLQGGDSKVASLRGRVLEGRRPGRTTIRVISPLTGALMGESEEIRYLMIINMNYLYLPYLPQLCFEFSSKMISMNL